MFRKKVKVKTVKFKVIKGVHHFQIWQLLIFVLVFASIGGFLTFRSFGLICACALGPSTPSNLTAAAASSSQINLSWTGSTESGYNGGFYYHIYRNGSQVDVVTSTSWADTGLSASSTYSYYVEAYDTYGSNSGLSNTASATTPAAPVPTPPTTPTNLTASAASSSQIHLSWGASSNISPITYYIYRNGSQAGTTTSLTYSDSGLSALTTYTYYVVARNGNGSSGASNTATATTFFPPNLPGPPTTPSNLTATAVSSSQINLSWTASTSQGDGVGGYEVFRNGSEVNVVFTTSWSNTGLSPSTTYSYYIIALSQHQEESGPSNTATATTAAIPPPTTPSNLSAEVLDDSEIDLNWSASTSSGGISYYAVYRNGGFVGTTSSTTLSDSGSSTAYYDTGLASAAGYSYYVVAVNNSGVASGPSNSASAVTLSTTPPSAPTGIKATVTSSSTVGLSWNASAINQAGIKEYDIYEVTPPDDTDDNGVLDGTLIASTSGTSYQVTGLGASTDCGFYVIAVDTTGNFSEQSGEALATTNTLGYAINVSLSASLTDIGAGQIGTVINTAIPTSGVTCTKRFDTDGSATDSSWSGSFKGLTGVSQVVYPPSGSGFYTFYSYELSCTNGASTAVSGISVRKYSDDVSN